MAPRKRGGRGISFIFCCFRNNDHPEITYRLRNDSNFALQTMEPALPMPPVEELDAMFSELVVSPGCPSITLDKPGKKRRGNGWVGFFCRYVLSVSELSVSSLSCEEVCVGGGVY